jgi:hypothetical protein
MGATIFAAPAVSLHPLLRHKFRHRILHKLRCALFILIPTPTPLRMLLLLLLLLPIPDAVPALALPIVFSVLSAAVPAMPPLIPLLPPLVPTPLLLLLRLHLPH